MEALAKVVGSSVERAPWGWYLALVVTLALIRVWPVLAKQAIEARAVIRKDRQNEESECDKKIRLLDDRLTAAEKAAHQFEMKLVGALAAYRILDVEVAAKVPNSIARDQAAAVLRDAFVLSPSTPNDVAEAIDSGQVAKAFP
jgi:hypothetical protein